MEETYEDKDKGLKMTKNETSNTRKDYMKSFIIVGIFFVNPNVSII